MDHEEWFTYVGDNNVLIRGKSVQSVINDLREKGYMEHRAPCCNEIFHCRHCHNEAKDDIRIVPKLRHDIPRHQVKQVICSLCGTEQEPSLVNYKGRSNY
ncbi:hypothetical protein AAHE18_18G219400 [Arachis hypogaea]